jgi:hypothetical protein
VRGVAYTTQPLAYYRLHGVNTTNTTRNAVSALSQAYCLAMVLARTADDRRYTGDMRDSVLRRVRAGVFDLFQEPGALVPKEMAFAAAAVHAVAPDKRLIQRLAAS